MIPHVKTIIDAAMKQKLVAAGLIERSHRINGSREQDRTVRLSQLQPIRS